MGFWSNGPTFRARRSRRERGRGAACRRPRPLRRGYLAVERAAVEQSRDIVGSRQRLGNHKVALPCHGQEAAQLCQGVAMVVGADVEPGIGIAAADPKRRRLAATLVAALQLAGLPGGPPTTGPRPAPPAPHTPAWPLP